MNLESFTRLHLPALETDEIRFNILIAALSGSSGGPLAGLDFWSLGAPGHCAIRAPGFPILLGNLDRAECRELARLTIADGPMGVVGADDTAHWFAENAISLGASFDPPIPQRLHVLRSRPRSPDVAGAHRSVTPDDAPLVFEWLTAFHREAVPHDPAPRMEQAERAAASSRYFFWTLGNVPVSMAAISRRLAHTGAIAPVYTPPEQRGRGYAGAVTTAAVEQIFSEGRTAACLYTDLRNPMSNRCYARIGFVPYCDSWLYPAKRSDG